MNEKPINDWDPRSEDVTRDQAAAYDDMRHRCPVAHSDYLNLSLFRHDDIMRVLNDPETFSSAVSSYLSVPNGMDPPEHTRYRSIIEPYFSPRRMMIFEPVCREIAGSLANGLSRGGEIEFNARFAQDFAMNIQCAFLGWPKELRTPLLHWIRKNREATLTGDRIALDRVAVEFDTYIKGLLVQRRKSGANAPDDITTSLLRERIGDRLLHDDEIVSVLRNWTVGELGTIAACVGILAHYLAEHPDIQRRLRAQPSLLPEAIDEILRIRAPLIANRRISTRPAEIGGRAVPAGQRITLIWASANRDETVFGEPDEFRLDRDPANNLLYGSGIHDCPGAPLAQLELRIGIEELLASTHWIALVPGCPPRTPSIQPRGFLHCHCTSSESPIARPRTCKVPSCL
ncbi:cytochrome P450 family protein [Paraburkholderia fungorum]|uniref:Cytochrome P450 n=1 Tax=Paraburkholderia fungorum TaxID=134537 RepID=A0AAP5UXT0_9BURK|nr:cytochrome P450 [Paraburkholderia fungorum]AJZ57074.1 cytochrome P450 family protein [Paraburkholderia fungorum]MDT8843315.1 cytochrome P450 [Paraburkholderia fungorum]